MISSSDPLQTFRQRLLWTVAVSWTVQPLGAVIFLLSFSGWSTGQVLELLRNFLIWGAVPIIAILMKIAVISIGRVEAGLGLAAPPSDEMLGQSWQTLCRFPYVYLLGLVFYLAAGTTAATVPAYLFSWMTKEDIVKI